MVKSVHNEGFVSLNLMRLLDHEISLLLTVDDFESSDCQYLAEIGSPTHDVVVELPTHVERCYRMWADEVVSHARGFFPVVYTLLAALRTL